MAMQFRTPVRRLQRCPDCRSRRLVVAVYSFTSNELDELQTDSRTIECERCCAVVLELPRLGPLAGRVHPTVLSREMTR